MSDPNTIRVLSLDGGGERGYLSNQFFKRFVQLWGINSSNIWQYFDVIAGTSVGGIMALAYAFGKSVDEVMDFFTVQGPYIFTTTDGVPSQRPSTLTKVADIIAGIPFYESSVETYGSGLLAYTLQNEFGSSNMSDLLTNVIVPSYQLPVGESDISKGTYVLFSNLNYPDFIGQEGFISDVALATSAAPCYLPSWTIGSNIYSDGGIYQNNPASFGRSLGQMIKPTASRCCILSLGTGLGELGFEDDPSPFKALSSDPFVGITGIFNLFGIAQVGAQESVAKSLFLESTYSLSQLYYYRFQPSLLNPPEGVITELDVTDETTLAYYDETAETYFQNDIVNISAFLGHLTA